MSNNIKNASCVILHKSPKSGNTHILFVRLKKSKAFGTPGGRMERGERPFEALRREFREETGHKMPFIENIKRIDYGNTRIYYGYTNDRTIVRRRLHNGETDLVCWRSYAGAKDVVFGRSNRYYIRQCVRESLKYMINNKLI